MSCLGLHGFLYHRPKFQLFSAKRNILWHFVISSKLHLAFLGFNFTGMLQFVRQTNISPPYPLQTNYRLTLDSNQMKDWEQNCLMLNFRPFIVLLQTAWIFALGLQAIQRTLPIFSLICPSFPCGTLSMHDGMPVVLFPFTLLSANHRKNFRQCFFLNNDQKVPHKTTRSLEQKIKWPNIWQNLEFFC